MTTGATYNTFFSGYISIYSFEASIYLEHLRLSDNSMTALIYKESMCCVTKKVKHDSLVSNKLKRVKFPQ